MKINRNCNQNIVVICTNEHTAGESVNFNFDLDFDFNLKWTQVKENSRPFKFFLYLDFDFNFKWPQVIENGRPFNDNPGGSRW